jgi:hypothetical protein
MIWLLMVIHLNLSVTPVQIQHGEVLEVFQTEQGCIAKHDEFFNRAKRENQPIPPYFNLGCVPLKRSVMENSNEDKAV